jgi:hypothetical protein
VQARNYTAPSRLSTLDLFKSKLEESDRFVNEAWPSMLQLIKSTT